MADSNKFLLRLPVTLCDKHIEAHKRQEFVVKACGGWTYIAIPTQCGSCNCLECIDLLRVPGNVNLSGAYLSRANLYGANLSGAVYSEYTAFDDKFKESDEFKKMNLIE